MDSFAQLFIFSLVMLAGSYGAGSAPLFMPMSEEKLQLVSVLGAGLLVGVALAVIIPEGVMTLIKAYTLKDHAVDHISGKTLVTLFDAITIFDLFRAFWTIREWTW